MACCGNRKRAARNYYSETFDTPAKKVGTISQSKNPECEVTYQMLLQAFNKVPGMNAPREEKEQIRYQLAKWISELYKSCPDHQKFTQIQNKIDGTDSSTDK